MDHVDALPEAQLLAAARGGDSAAFERLVAGYRAALLAHCYRMLGSSHDAEDALQEALLGAWRGLAGFEGRSSLRAWLYRVTTNACLRLIARRPRRMLSADHGPPRRDTDDPGADGRSELVDAFVTAWERADLPALLGLLAEDARFTMPPLPAWFDGRDDVGRFFAERVFATPWRLMPLRVNGQLGFACYLREPGADRFRLGAINLLSLRAGRIVQIDAFLDPKVHRHLGLADEFRGDRVSQR